jgi:hypothetical protein
VNPSVSQMAWQARAVSKIKERVPSSAFTSFFHSITITLLHSATESFLDSVRLAEQIVLFKAHVLAWSRFWK